MAEIGNIGLTAYAGGGKANAVQLAYGINRITTCASLGDSVKLPAAVQGQSVRVINAGAQPCNIYPYSTDTVNGLATTLGQSLAPGAQVEFFCSVAPSVAGTPTVIGAGNWEGGAIGTLNTARIALATNGAIDSHTSARYVATKAGVLAMTLAAPTDVTDNGVRIELFSDTANAHTLTATALLDTGSANAAIATFAAFKGAGVVLEAYGARWKVISQIGITFS